MRNGTDIASGIRPRSRPRETETETERRRNALNSCPRLMCACGARHGRLPSRRRRPPPPLLLASPPFPKVKRFWPWMRVLDTSPTAALVTLRAVVPPRTIPRWEHRWPSQRSTPAMPWYRRCELMAIWSPSPMMGPLQPCAEVADLGSSSCPPPTSLVSARQERPRSAPQVPAAPPCRGRPGTCRPWCTCAGEDLSNTVRELGQVLLPPVLAG